MSHNELGMEDILSEAIDVASTSAISATFFVFAGFDSELSFVSCLLYCSSGGVAVVSLLLSIRLYCTVKIVMLKKQIEAIKKARGE